MGSTQRGKYADGGLDDVTQGEHLAWLTDTRLEDADLCLFVEEPYGEGDAYLRVVTTRRTHNLLRGQQQLIQPLFDHRLTIGACDTHDGDVELVAMTLGQTL